MMPVSPSPMCQELLTSCEGLQKQGWQVNTMEEQWQNKPWEVSLTISRLLNMELTEFAYVFSPHFMYTSTRNSLWFLPMCWCSQELGQAPRSVILLAKVIKAIYLHVIMHIPIPNSQKYLYPGLFRTFSCTFVWLTESLFHWQLQVFRQKYPIPKERWLKNRLRNEW